MNSLESGIPLEKRHALAAFDDVICSRCGLAVGFWPSDKECPGLVHFLKTWPEYFAAVREGRKRFELRHTDDRVFHVGDRLLLQEWDEKTGLYTGEAVWVRVTYLLPLPAQLVCMSIELEP